MKQSEKIDKIFYAMFGMDGEDGLVKRNKNTEIKLDALFKIWDRFSMTRRDTCPVKNKKTELRNVIIKYTLAAAGWATLITKLLGWW